MFVDEGTSLYISIGPSLKVNVEPEYIEPEYPPSPVVES